MVYIQRMDPVIIGSAAASQVLKLVDWKGVFKSLIGDAAREGTKSLLSYLKPSDRERAARQSITLFAQEWYSELEDKTPLSSALPGYRDELKRLVEHAAQEIAGWINPEIKEVDLGPVERTWSGLKLDPLPEDFSWTLVAQNYGRAIRNYIKNNAELRAAFLAALQERATDAAERIAGLDAGFDLSGYSNPTLWTTLETISAHIKLVQIMPS